MSDELKNAFQKRMASYAEQLTLCQQLINIACSQNQNYEISRFCTQADTVRSDYEKFLKTTDAAGIFLPDDDFDPSAEVPRIDIVTSNGNKVKSW